MLTGISPDPLDNKKMAVHGTLVTADKEDADKIEKIVSSKYLDKGMPLKWEHSFNGKRHEFIISGVERQKKDSSLKISWNGGAIGQDMRGELEVEVPAQGVFKVMDVRAVRGEKPFVGIYFSSNVSTRQNIKGLI